MEEQEYIIEKPKSFDSKHIFECGQCFRWKKNQDGTYIGMIGQSVIHVKEQKDYISFTGICKGDIKKICIEYFDLDRDYENIKQKLSNVDNHMKTSIQYGQGIRILNQDLWETLISFIISANNNIPRIKKIIENLSKAYGKKIVYKGEEYYSFPTPEELKKASITDLRELGLGFRDKRVFDTTEMIVEKQIHLENLYKIKDTEELRKELMRFPGVGEKVADCVMLFSTLKRLDAFPVDVWVRRVINELYIKQKEEQKVSKEIIKELAKEKYEDLAGIAQQYLFYWKREA